MIDFIAEEKEFKNILSKFEGELKKIRTGRASSVVLESIMVDSYGTLTPLMHVAALSSPDPKSIIVRPWDRTILPAIEQALEKANLGVSIISEKDQVRVVFPALTEERRKEFVKIVGKQAEEARIKTRRRRDEIWKTIQEEERSKLISENKKIEEMTEKKEKEIMTI